MIDATSASVAALCLVSVAALAGLGGLGYYTFKLWQKCQSLSKQVASLSEGAVISARRLWLKELPGLSCESELGVEIKFLYPLLRHLGCRPNDLKTRVQVTVQVGRQSVNGVADWVLYRQGRPYMVIEAKEPGQSLNGAAQGQARSYAQALNAVYYMLTNGRQIVIYQRGVPDDRQVVLLDAGTLEENWNKLDGIIG